MTRDVDLNSLHAVLFDFDGVVVQSENVYDKATTKLGALYGVEITDAFFDANRGVAEMAFYENFKATFNLNIDLEELQANGKKLLWAEFTASVYLTPGFQQFYNKIRQQDKLIALVTATSRPLLSEILQNSKISVEFDQIVTSSDVKKGKPAPDPYHRACELLNVNPDKALVIEDSPTGLRSATVAGCRTVGITTSCKRESLKDANFVVDSFGELEELLTIV